MSASLVTYASIQALKPDLIINAGTAGGFKVCVFGKIILTVLRFIVLRPEILQGFSIFISSFVD